MNNLLSEHTNDIDNIIKFLEDYKLAINNVELNKNTLISVFLLNNSIEELKDKALEVLNSCDCDKIKPHLQKELDEYNDTMNNMKKLLPFLTLFQINSINLFQEDI